MSAASLTGPILLLLLPDAHYKRFVGRRCTHHVVASGAPLDAAQIEAFRRDPDGQMGD